MSEKEQAQEQEQEINPILKMVLEFGPLLVLFFANSKNIWLVETFPFLENLGKPLVIATACFMVAITISLVVSWLLLGKLPMMPLVTGVVVLVFGGLTILFNDNTFIKLKPTIINICFGTLLLGGLFFGKSLLQLVLDSALKLDDEGWYKLTLRWGIFFFVLAIINEIVWRGALYYYGDATVVGEPDKLVADDFWLNFKVWGFMPISMIFMLFQFPLLKRHMLVEEGEEDKEKDKEKEKEA